MSHASAKRRLRQELDSREHQILSTLRHLSRGLEAATDRVKDRESIDEHLIANAASLTAEIARWNLTLDLLPHLEEEP